MNHEYALNQCTTYLLDILDLPPGPLPDRAQEHWGDVFKLASDQRIYHYLATWMLEYWDDALSPELKHRLWMDLEWNKVRNIKLTQEIVELAKMFNEAGVTAMFLKGAAGLVRGLYPLQGRYISDIDCLLKIDQIEKGHELLESFGYVLRNKRNVKTHHYGPYSAQGRVGEIELHIDPYQLNYYSRNDSSELWDNADRIIFHNQKICIPSIQDFIWIMMRTDLLARVCLPRLKDLIEFNYLIDKSYEINYNLIYQRAKDFNIPFTAVALFSSLKRYFKIEVLTDGIENSEALLINWEKWSYKYRKENLYNDDQYYSLEKDIAAVKYYTDGSLLHTIDFIRWLFPYHRRMYCEKILKKTGLLPFVMKVNSYWRG